MRERGEAKVKIVVDAGLLKTLGLGNGRPDLGEILDERGSEVGERRGAEMVTDDEEEEGSRGGSNRWHVRITDANAKGAHSLLVLEEKLQIHLKDGLEQAHVCALVKADLVLPNIEDQDLARGERKECTLALKVLVLAALATVGSLDVHDENVVGHFGAGALGPLVLGHPNALCGLPTLRLGHDGEVGAKEVVEEGRLAGGLGTEDGDEVVVEAGISDGGELQIVVEVVATLRTWWLAQYVDIMTKRPAWMVAGNYHDRGITSVGDEKPRALGDLLEVLFLVNDLNAMFVAAGGRLLTDGREVAVHDGDVDGRVSDGGRRWARKETDGSGSSRFNKRKKKRLQRLGRSISPKELAQAAKGLEIVENGEK